MAYSTEPKDKYIILFEDGQVNLYPKNSREVKKLFENQIEELKEKGIKASIENGVILK